MLLFIQILILEALMKMRNLALVMVILAVFLSGCGKKKEEKTTEQPNTTATTQTDNTGPKIEADKLAKAIDVLPQFGNELIALNNDQNKPQNQQEALEQMTTAMDKIAKNNGFTDGKELISYVDFIVQISSIQNTVDNLDSILSQLPPDKQNSPEVQNSVKNLKDKYEDIRKQYGDEILSMVSKNKAKIQNFFDQLQSIRNQQAQAQPQGSKKFQQIKGKSSQTPPQDTDRPKVRKKK